MDRMILFGIMEAKKHQGSGLQQQIFRSTRQQGIIMCMYMQHYQMVHNYFWIVQILKSKTRQYQLV